MANDEPRKIKQKPTDRAVSVARMQEIDARAIEEIGIPRLLLMEHAGLAVARRSASLYEAGRKSMPPSAPIVICCGTGYNGGDGLCAARHLHNWGYPQRIVLAGLRNHLRKEPAIYAAILERLGVAIEELVSLRQLDNYGQLWSGCGIIIDALLGIGIQGKVRQIPARLIESMNLSKKPIVAVDIPSGLNGDSGLCQGEAVRATCTVSFGLAKRGCMQAEGPAHVGELNVDSITIPRALLESI